MKFIHFLNNCLRVVDRLQTKKLILQNFTKHFETLNKILNIYSRKSGKKSLFEAFYFSSKTSLIKNMASVFYLLNVPCDNQTLNCVSNISQKMFLYSKIIECGYMHFRNIQLLVHKKFQNGLSKIINLPQHKMCPTKGLSTWDTFSFFLHPSSADAANCYFP